jgi:hypothetical protein
MLELSIELEWYIGAKRLMQDGKFNLSGFASDLLEAIASGYVELE